MQLRGFDPPVRRIFPVEEIFPCKMGCSKDMLIEKLFAMTVFINFGCRLVETQSNNLDSVVLKFFIIF